MKRTLQKSAASVLSAMGIAIVIAFASSAAYAAPVSFQLTLNQSIPGADTILGSFVIDDSFLTPNAQVPFTNFSSFDISVAGISWDLGDKYAPADEGVLTDGSGTPFRFNDTVGNLTEFCPGGLAGNCGTFLRFEDNTNNYDTSGGTPNATAGTYSIARLNQVPEPGTIALLGVALVGFALRRRAR